MLFGAFLPLVSNELWWLGANLVLFVSHVLRQLYRYFGSVLCDAFLLLFVAFPHLPPKEL